MSNNVNDIFSIRLKERRQKLHLTLEEVGTKVGVTRATVQRWETGKIVNVKSDKISKLAEALQCPVAYLMGWEHEEFEEEEPREKFDAKPERVCAKGYKPREKSPAPKQMRPLTTEQAARSPQVQRNRKMLDMFTELSVKDQEAALQYIEFLVARKEQ